MREIVYGLGILLIIVGLVVVVGNITGWFVTVSRLGFLLTLVGAGLTWLARLFPPANRT